MAKSQFNLAKLPISIHEISDEIDGETVLTLVSNGDHGVTGYLMLKADADLALGSWFFSTMWEWQVSEPDARETLFGSEDSLDKAAEKLSKAMADMVEIVQQRGGS